MTGAEHKPHSTLDKARAWLESLRGTKWVSVEKGENGREWPVGELAEAILDSWGGAGATDTPDDDRAQSLSPARVSPPEDLVAAARAALDVAEDWGADTWRVTGFGREKLYGLLEQLEAARRVIRETSERVHLVLDDHYSGRQEERVAALPAYGWLTLAYEYEDENHDGQIRPVEEIILAVHASNPASEPEDAP